MVSVNNYRLLQAYGGVYDAAGSMALSSTPAALEGDTNGAGTADWDGSFGPTAYNTTLTATSFDGITPQVSGIYEIVFSCDWITAAAHTVTFAIYQGAAIVATGAQVRSMSVTETASAYQAVNLRVIADLDAGAEVRIFVNSAASTPTLTYRDLIFYIRRICAAA